MKMSQNLRQDKRFLFVCYVIQVISMLFYYRIIIVELKRWRKWYEKWIFNLQLIVANHQHCQSNNKA